jgi:hypothetical protein
MKNLIFLVLILLQSMTTYCQADGIYYIKLANGKVLDADAGQVHTNGCKIQIWDNVGGVNQKWEIKKDHSNGTFTIKSLASGKFLDIHAGDVSRDGGKVQLWDRVPGNKNQNFVFTDRGSSRYTIHCASCNTSKPEELKFNMIKVLDVTGRNIGTNGTPIITWGYFNDNRDNQIWYLERASDSNVPPSSGRKVLIDIDLNYIAVAEASRDKIDNDDCRRVFGEIKAELYEIDNNNQPERLIPSYNSGTSHLFIEKNFDKPPFIGVDRFGSPRSSYENSKMKTVTFNVDETLLKSSKLMLVLKTNLGTRHKDNNFASYDILRMKEMVENSVIINDKLPRKEEIRYNTDVSASDRSMHIMDLMIPHNVFFRTDDEHRLWVGLTIKRK